MGRGRTTFFDAIAALPWPVGLGVGACGYLAIAHGIPLLFARADTLDTAFRGTNPFMPLAWVFLGLCMFVEQSIFSSQRFALSVEGESTRHPEGGGECGDVS